MQISCRGLHSHIIMSPAPTIAALAALGTAYSDLACCNSAIWVLKDVGLWCFQAHFVNVVLMFVAGNVVLRRRRGCLHTSTHAPGLSQRTNPYRELTALISTCDCSSFSRSSLQHGRSLELVDYHKSHHRDDASSTYHHRIIRR
jgi:hypothetical protein